MNTGSILSSSTIAANGNLTAALNVVCGAGQVFAQGSNAGFTGTLAAAISGGRNVGGGIIY
jgi:hypothetical protein